MRHSSPRARDAAHPVTATPDPSADLSGRPRFPEPVRVLIAFVALVAAIFLPLLPQLPLARMIDVRAMSLGTQVALGVVFLALTTALAYVFVVLAARHIDRVPLAAYGLGRSAGRTLGALGIGLLIAVLVMVATAGVAGALGWSRPMDDVTQGVPMVWAVIHLLGLAFLLQGIPEELIFRGYLLTTLRRHGWAASVWISAAVFGVAHLISAGGQEGWVERVLYLAGPFGFAVAAGALRLLTDSVWAAVGIHAGAHVGTFIAGLLGLSVEGPFPWIVSGVVFTLVGVVVLRMFARRREEGRATIAGLPAD